MEQKKVFKTLKEEGKLVKDRIKRKKRFNYFAINREKLLKQKHSKKENEHLKDIIYFNNDEVDNLSNNSFIVKYELLNSDLFILIKSEGILKLIKRFYGEN